jgi:hypothetical protein
MDHAAMSPKAIASIHSDRRIRPPFVLLIVSEADALYTSAGAKDGVPHPIAYLANKRRKVVITPGFNN